MPYNQINTPARRVITQMFEQHTSDSEPRPAGYALGWARDGEVLLDNQHWENTPTLFIGWSGGPISGSPDAAVPGDSSLQLVMEVDCDEVLRAADEIKRNRRLNEEGAGVGVLPTWRFETVVIHRPEAQMLIRTARRARDAVFGADD